MLSTRDRPQKKDTFRLKVKGWKKISHANRDQKKAGVAILISDKIDFKTDCGKRQRRSLHCRGPAPADPGYSKGRRSRRPIYLFIYSEI